MRRHTYRLFAALALMAALTACGGEASTGTQPGGGNPASAAASLDPQAKGLKFAQCMRENGIDMDDPEPGKPARIKITGTDEQTAQRAMEACREWAPPGATGGKVDPQRAEQMRKFAQCMRDNGVEAFPDQEGAGIRLDKSITDDPDFEAADEKCSTELVPGTRR